MTRFKFLKFADYEDGKIACLETTEKMQIPVNIFIDNYDDIKDLELRSCQIDVCGIGSSVKIFENEEEFLRANIKMMPESLIPMGTFSLNLNDENFEQSPNIIFCGTVEALEIDEETGEGEPNYCLLIKTLEMELNLYIRYDGRIEPGNIVYSVAWLFGNLAVPL